VYTFNERYIVTVILCCIKTVNNKIPSAEHNKLHFNFLTLFYTTDDTDVTMAQENAMLTLTIV